MDNFSSLVIIVFQSTPLREGRQIGLFPILYYLNFNPRPYVRGDYDREVWVVLEVYFNPRPYVRGDFHIHFLRHFLHLFQSTPLREGRRN